MFRINLFSLKAMNNTTNESKPVQLTNLEAIEKILDGEKGMFELIIRRNNASLYKVGRAYGYNHQDTEDLMQETYLEAYLHLSQLKSAAALKTWLIRIMLNKCNYRKMKFSYKNEYPSENLLNETSVPMFSSHRSDSAAIVANNELKNVIEAALQKISTDHRMVFLYGKSMVSMLLKQPRC
jgi:RNA polymerase sigma-70 factor (ECF subfamily)